MSGVPEAKHWSRFTIFWILAGTLEFPFVLAFMTGRDEYLVWQPQLVLGMHLLATLTLFFSLPKGIDWFHNERCWPKTFVLWIGFLPFFGWLLCGVLYFFYIPPGDIKKIFEEDAPEGGQGPVAEHLYFRPHVAIDRVERLKQGLDFIPLADIMAGRDVMLKRGAVENLFRLASYESIRLLLSYRSDQDPEVRFYVTSALTRLKKDLDEELDAAKRQMQKDVYKISSRIFLAKIYLRYSKTGLLDHVTGQRYREEAVHHLKFSIASTHARAEAYWALYDIYCENHNWDDALVTLSDLEKSAIEAPSVILKAKVVTCFKRRDFTGVIHWLKEMETKNLMDADWLPLANVWGVTKS